MKRFLNNIKNILEECAQEKYRAYWLLLFVTSIMGMTDIPPVNNLKIALPIWLKWTGICFIASMKATLFLMLLPICRKHLATRVIYYTASAIYIFLCATNFFCLHFFEIGISNKMITLIAETNPAEASEFISTSFEKIKDALSWHLLLALTIVGVIYGLIRFMPRTIYTRLIAVSSLIGAMAFCALVADTFDGKNFYSVYARTAKGILTVYKETTELNALIDKLPAYSNANRVTSSRKAVNTIVVYGESADRDHLSIYGYKLPTSPYMDSISDNLYIFRDVISAAKLTKESMEHMLTLKKDSDHDNWWNFPLLIDILKAGGYKTFWVSNQERTGIWGNSVGAITSRADESRYIGKTSNSDPLLQKYDENLIPELNDILSDTITSKWIGLHLMGSHFVYENRYPSNFGIFTAKDVEMAHPRKWMGGKQYLREAQYDNSIRYTDYVVGQMIDLIERQSQPSILIYLSDHGENVYKDRDYCGRDLTSVRIPFVIYANEAYKRENQDLIDALSKSIDLKISSANLPYAIMTLTGTDCPDYDATCDFISPEYVEKERYVAGKPWQFEKN